MSMRPTPAATRRATLAREEIVLAVVVLLVTTTRRRPSRSTASKGTEGQRGLGLTASDEEGLEEASKHEEGERGEGDQAKRPGEDDPQPRAVTHDAE